MTEDFPKALEITHKSLIFGGEFDFVQSDKLESGDVEIKLENFSIIMETRIERMLRGLKIDYSKEEKDFTASKVNE